MTPLHTRFAQVARAARDNLGVAVDLVLVHNEKTVRGRQPRASLNRALVVTTIGAWDRFIADTRSAFSTDVDLVHWVAGQENSVPKELYASKAEQVLVDSTACDSNFLNRLRVNAATGWSGVRMTAMEQLTGHDPGKRSGLTFSQHLNQWVTLRNALAHGSLHQLLNRVSDPRRWTDKAIGDPYASILHDRYRLWHSDAEGDSSVPPEQRMIGATIQAGCARSCLALIIQLVDWLIVEICSAHHRDWDADDLRLPSDWFQRDLPVSFRGSTAGEHAHWSLWGGPSLHRR
ncbi:hypothetical protein [Salinispora vitiensis]|uniref:hypothetical protein n=1 Tax=Salinispora vitiensis TaxID=999544 RepID=UPI0003828565|nr:hypothetical protein [Salinispora vitiensis]